MSQTRLQAGGLSNVAAPVGGAGQGAGASTEPDLKSLDPGTH